ncbi:uncharacterized protein LOC132729851 [Ruditapes philippinarum]|uniref:uncharacterized protein LOC132729851 n=1 Tax=Ruditapes philippinarum TaxID=129788 RepID=UPI00295B7331|nr:uncharacterized protein LOC132729851 [Ruditapes philippinarum]
MAFHYSIPVPVLHVIPIIYVLPVLNPETINSQINKELIAGRVAGPFNERPLPNLIVSPIGLVQYTSFDQAIKMIQDLGQHCKLFKSDIKSAYRLIPIKPSDFELLGFRYNDKFYFDKALPFGASISCRTFERFSRFLEFRITFNFESGKLIHYLDDFLGGDTSMDSCNRALQIFRETMSELGVPLAEDKTEGPTESLVFLGLELDSNKMFLSRFRELAPEADLNPCKVPEILWNEFSLELYNCYNRD